MELFCASHCSYFVIKIEVLLDPPAPVLALFPSPQRQLLTQSAEFSLVHFLPSHVNEQPRTLFYMRACVFVQEVLGALSAP